MSKPGLRVVLAQPRGFCAGVERAIAIVERALERFGPPVYVRHEIVHNKHVVEALKSKGARFVDDVDEIPEGAVTVFSAHGVAESVEIAGRARGFLARILQHEVDHLDGILYPMRMPTLRDLSFTSELHHLNSWLEQRDVGA